MLPGLQRLTRKEWGGNLGYRAPPPSAYTIILYNIIIEPQCLSYCLIAIIEGDGHVHGVHAPFHLQDNHKIRANVPIHSEHPLVDSYQRALSPKGWADLTRRSMNTMCLPIQLAPCWRKWRHGAASPVPHQIACTACHLAAIAIQRNRT